MEKVSVIIPVYNVERYIGRCVKSVLDQSYSNIEVLLIDDCSPDASMKVASDVINRHPRKGVVKVITHKKNQGLSCARNTGIDAATGEYLYFIDSDDYISQDAIERLVVQALAYDAEMSIGKYVLVGGNRRLPNLSLPSGVLEGNVNIVNALYRGRWFVMAGCKLVKTAFVKSNGLYFEPGLLHEDDVWTFKLASRLNRMAVAEDAVYYYVIHEGSITGSGMTDRHFECRVKGVKLMYEWLNVGGDSSRSAALLSLFEYNKSEYMKVVHIFTHDKVKEREMYDVIRSTEIDRTRIKLYGPERFLSLNYRLPKGLGCLFYKYAVLLRYKLYLLKIKLGLA